jgi:hypothetical protein
MSVCLLWISRTRFLLAAVVGIPLPRFAKSDENRSGLESNHRGRDHIIFMVLYEGPLVPLGAWMISTRFEEGPPRCAEK